MDALGDVIDAPELQAGLLAGLAALVVGALLARELRRRAPRSPGPPGIVGAAVVLATVAALAVSSRSGGAGPVPARVVVALTLLGIAGELGARTNLGIGVVSALVGGLVLVDPSDWPAAWITAILVLGPALGGTAAAGLDRRTGGTGLGPQLLAVSIVGLAACVPDTELALAVSGAMLPLVLLTWPRVLARLGAGGTYAAIGLFCWIAAVGGAPRPGSIVGAVAALGLLVAAPLGRILAVRSARGPRRVVVPGVFLGAQLLLAAYASRVAGRFDDPVVAAAVALPAIVLGVAVGARFAVGAGD